MDNGEPKTIGEVAGDILSALARQRERILDDMRPHFPALRSHLLGREVSGDVYPPGRITVEVDVSQCIVRLEIPMLDYYAEYTGTSCNDLIERMENDLDLQTVPWRQGWKTKKRLKDAAERVLRSS